MENGLYGVFIYLFCGGIESGLDNIFINNGLIIIDDIVEYINLKLLYKDYLCYF